MACEQTTPYPRETLKNRFERQNMINKPRIVTLFLSLLCLSPWWASAAPVYFVVSEINPITVHGDSYLLPLENPADISHARDLIALGPSIGGAIAVAHIAAGPDGINRDVLAPGEPLWSWHVDWFAGFADITTEIVDGWPSYVEQDVAGWIGNTGGLIGFWSYTVTAEISPVPVPGALALFLSGLLGISAVWYRSPAKPG